MTGQPVPHCRRWDDPRRHVPRLVYIPERGDHIPGVWQLSVRDHRNEHHVKCHDTWTEAKANAGHWAQVNLAHGCTIHQQGENPSWAD